MKIENIDSAHFNKLYEETSAKNKNIFNHLRERLINIHESLSKYPKLNFADSKEKIVSFQNHLKYLVSIQNQNCKESIYKSSDLVNKKEKKRIIEEGLNNFSKNPEKHQYNIDFEILEIVKFLFLQIKPLLELFSLDDYDSTELSKFETVANTSNQKNDNHNIKGGQKSWLHKIDRELKQKPF